MFSRVGVCFFSHYSATPRAEPLRSASRACLVCAMPRSTPKTARAPPTHRGLAFSFAPALALPVLCPEVARCGLARWRSLAAPSGLAPALMSFRARALSLGQGRSPNRCGSLVRKGSRGLAHALSAASRGSALVPALS